MHAQRTLVSFMAEHDTILELHGRGLSAHDLRSFYLDDRGSGFPCPPSRQELVRYTQDDEVAKYYFLSDWMGALDDAERKATEALLSGKVLGLGYADPIELCLTCVPFQQWHFLGIDFDNSAATATDTGTDLHYAGLRFLFKSDLTAEQIQVIEASWDQPEVARPAQEAEFKTDGYEWAGVTLRFVENDIVEAKLGKQKRKYALGQIGLLNKTTGKPNYAAMYLIRLATHSSLPDGRGVKDAVSDIRKSLRSIFPGLQGDPIPKEGPNGYVPQFKVIDARDALDKRAKERAIHTPHVDDSSQSSAPENNYSFDSEDDEAGQFIRQQTGQP